jgi:SAM-dependent methyltransferase
MKAQTRTDRGARTPRQNPNIAVHEKDLDTPRPVRSEATPGLLVWLRTAFKEMLVTGSSAYWLEAEANANVGFPPSGRVFRRGLGKLLWPFLSRQVAVNRALLAELDAVRQRLDQAEQRLDRTDGDLAHHTEVLVRHEEPLDRHGLHLTLLQKDLEELGKTLESFDPLIWANREVASTALEEVRALAPSVEDVVAKHPDELRQIEQQAFARFHDAMSSMRTEFGDVSQLIEERFDEFKRLEIGVQDARGRLAAIEMLMSTIRRALPSEPSVNELRTTPSSADLMYVGLEELMRGPRQTVIARLTGYLDELAAQTSRGTVLDVGSGRGEWLGMLKEAGAEAYGVELEMAYVSEAHERGLDVRHEDLLAHLRTLKDASLRAITAFHVVEHLPTELLLEFLNESLRVLEPNGLLILETPNPENLIVAACTFYLDPTHLHPLPPLLLEFFVRSRGFGETRVEFKNPATGAQITMPSAANPWYAELAPIVNTLNERFFGSQDYAVIARRS